MAPPPTWPDIPSYDIDASAAERVVAAERQIKWSLLVFGFTGEEFTNSAKLKDTFRALSLQSHPDRMGTDAAMQKVNIAYEILQECKEAWGRISHRNALPEEVAIIRDEKERAKLSRQLIEEMKARTAAPTAAAGKASPPKAPPAAPKATRPKAAPKAPRRK